MLFLDDIFINVEFFVFIFYIFIPIYLIPFILFHIKHNSYMVTNNNVIVLM